jgi:aminoglycoside phosphotransferase (APT) family kinase protein
MSDAYASHLAGLHGGFAVTDELIRRAARAVSASPLAAKERIVHGEANEVYALAFESGAQVIMRIARRASGKFEKERWAIDRCRALRIRAPEVLSIERLEVDGESVEVCLMQKLSGERLSDRLDLPRETLRHVVHQVGEDLSRMHTISDADLGEGASFFVDDTDDFLVSESEFIALGADAGLDGEALAHGFRFFEATMAEHTPLPRCLTHNDLRACHVMVHEGELSGLIDFGEVSIDSPINEFAKWDYWDAPDLPVAWLEEGYADKTLFGPGYGALFASYRFANALWALRWYALTGYAAGVDRARNRLTRYLEDPALG